jgi:ABC-2 type transport system permease protein
MWQRLKSMLIKEFIQALRNPRMRIILFLPPLVQLLIFGYAANTDIRNISLGVYDLDNTPESREMIGHFASSGYFRLVESPKSPQEIRRRIDEGKISAALQINSGFARQLSMGPIPIRPRWLWLTPRESWPSIPAKFWSSGFFPCPISQMR